MGRKVVAACATMFLWISGVGLGQDKPLCGTPDGFPPLISPIDTTRALAIFCCFPEDTFDTAQGGSWPQAMHAELPEWYDDLLDSTVEGSASDFYVQQCYDRHILTGESKGRPVGLDSMIYFVTSDSMHYYSSYGAANLDILIKADSFVNFADFDQDGDGIVDEVFMQWFTHPWPWLGVASIGTIYKTCDTTAAGDTVEVRIGTTQATDYYWNIAVHTNTHEYGHHVGVTIDWYNVSNCGWGGMYTFNGFNPWGGWRFPFYSCGWPVSPLSPRAKVRMGWCTPIDVEEPFFDVEIPDFATSQTGDDVVYRLWIDEPSEYFLVTNC